MTILKFLLNLFNFAFKIWLETKIAIRIMLLEYSLNLKSESVINPKLFKSKQLMGFISENNHLTF